MTLFIFGFGVLVFFLTVYGSVVAGGIKLTTQQLEGDKELADRAGLDGDSSPTRNTITSEF